MNHSCYSLALVLVALVAGVYILVRRGHLRSTFLGREFLKSRGIKNFENSLYEEAHSANKDGVGEAVNIIAPGRGSSGSFSVSYNNVNSPGDLEMKGSNGRNKKSGVVNLEPVDQADEEEC